MAIATETLSNPALLFHSDDRKLDFIQLTFTLSGLMQQIRLLKTHEQVVDALGGKPAFAKLITTTDSPYTVNHVGAYLRQKFFPSKTYVIVTSALREIHCSAPNHLWGMIEQKKKKRAA